MGYSTTFSLHIKQDINKELVGDQTTEARIATYILSLEDSCLEDFLYQGVFSEGESFSAKWYDHEEDMRALSVNVPDVIFELHGEGEDHADQWIKYFLNGKMQACHATVTVKYPEFNLEAMK